MPTLSAKEAARELGTDARTLRKFMRAILPKEDQPGQGNRYHIEQKSISKLKKQFAEWQQPKAKPSTNGVAAEVIEDDFDFEEVSEADELAENELISEDEDFLASDIEDEELELQEDDLDLEAL